MNSLLDALTDHYNANEHMLLVDPGDNHARAVPYGFRAPAHTVVWLSAVLAPDSVVRQLRRLAETAPFDVLVLATWKDGLTIGDEAELKAAGVTVLALEREAEHV